MRENRAKTLQEAARGRQRWQQRRSGKRQPPLHPADALSTTPSTTQGLL
jgi:hypothetical protein